MATTKGVRDMLLAIDVGNTQTVLGIYEGDTLQHMWRLATDHVRTSDELRVHVGGLLQAADVSPAQIDGAVLATVVPTLKRRWQKVCRMMFDVETLAVNATVASKLLDTSAYRNQAGIGADRIADAVAARELYGAPVIVLDFGTATNMEAVDRDGNFVGGVIAPGVETSMKALFQGAALLPEVELADPKVAIGLDTVEAIQIGLVYGEVDRADALVRRMWGQLGYETPVVATGGLSTAMGPLCQTVTDINPELTLEGLRIIYENVER